MKGPWISCCCALGLAACAARAAPGAELGTPYHTAVGRWTSQAEIYQDGEQRARFAATLESASYRQERVLELARLQAWPPGIVAAEQEAQAAAAAAETSFVVGVYTDVPRASDLSNAESIWKLVLESPAGATLPTKIESMGRLNDNAEALYPYLDRFTKVYRVHFGRVPSGPLTLTIGSGVGKVTLKFDRI